MQTKKKMDYLTRMENGEDIYNTLRVNGELPQRVKQNFSQLLGESLCAIRVDGKHTSIHLTAKGRDYLARKTQK